MNLRRRVLLAMAVLLIAAVAALFFVTRPPPVLTVMTWPGPFGRAQTNAQMHTYAADRSVDVRPAFWDGDLADVQAMVDKRLYKADVIDFELPKAVQACKGKLLEMINPAMLPAGANGVAAARDFVPGSIGPCWVGSQVYSQVIVFSSTLEPVPATLADFFDVTKFHGRRALSRASAKYNLEMALLADGVAPGDVYKTLESPEGLDRAFAKLKALHPIWAHDSVGALEWLKDGQAVMVTALNGDVANLKDYVPGGMIWDHQLYEMDAFGIPAGDPNKKRALDYIFYATASVPLAGVSSWVPFGPARHSSLPLVKANPETGQAMAPLLPTAPGNFRNAFAVDDGWWLVNGAGIAPRWQEFVSQ